MNGHAVGTESTNLEPRYVPGGAHGYFLGGYVRAGAPNWHPVLKKFPLKLIPSSRNGPIFILRSRKFVIEIALYF